MGESVEAAGAPVPLTHAVDAHVDLPEDAAAIRVPRSEAEAAGGQVRRDADGPRVHSQLEQIRKVERLASAERDVEHPDRGQLVEDAPRVAE